jgi:hypothetical protein
VNVMLFGDRKATLPSNWSKETIVSLAGDAELDGSAGAAANATLTFVALFGDLTMRVPPGSRVSLSGVGLFGDRKIEVAPGDGPQIQVNAYGLFSDVKILSDPPRSP